MRLCTPCILLPLLLSLSCTSEEETVKSSDVTLLGLKFTGPDFSAHDGQTLRAGLVEQSTGNMVADTSVTVAGGNFLIEWPSVIDPNQTYYVDYYADLNENGSCDAPPTDHAWRFAVRNYTAEVTLQDSHSMNFFDVCPSFTGTPPATGETVEVNISGQLQVGPAVSEGALTPGNAIADAAIFVEGFPDSEAKSDADGSFALKLELPKSSELTTQPFGLVMWHTTSSQEGDVIKTWDENALRIGARKELSFAPSDGAEVPAGTVDLSYTGRAKITVVDSTTSTGVDDCWLQFPDYGANVWFEAKGSGVFEIDYLPPATYQIRLTCTGYEVLATTISVGTATSKGEVLDSGTIQVTPSAT